MCRNCFSCLKIILLFFLLQGTSSTAQAHYIRAMADEPSLLKIVRMRGDEWMPYYGATDPEKPGYMVELADKILKANGLVLEFEVTPWNRAIATTERGDSHCIVGALVADAPGFLFPQQPSGVDTVNFYVRRQDPWRFMGENSLTGRRTGIIADYAYGNDYLGSYLKDPANQPSIIEVRGSYPLLQLVTLLKHKRIDAFLENTEVVNYYQATHPGAAFMKPAGQVGPKNPMYFACSPALPRTSHYLLDILDKGVEELRASGWLGTLLAKYNLTDWQGHFTQND